MNIEDLKQMDIKKSTHQYNVKSRDVLMKQFGKKEYKLSFADDDIIQLDIDSRLQSELERVEQRIRLVKLFKCGYRRKSRNKGYHYVLGLKSPLSLCDRIELQLMLGSDPCREEFNKKRINKKKREHRECLLIEVLANPVEIIIV